MSEKILLNAVQVYHSHLYFKHQITNILLLMQLLEKDNLG